MNTKTDFINNTYIDDNINIAEIDDDYIERMLYEMQFNRDLDWDALRKEITYDEEEMEALMIKVCLYVMENKDRFFENDKFVYKPKPDCDHKDNANDTSINATGMLQKIKEFFIEQAKRVFSKTIPQNPRFSLPEITEKIKNTIFTIYKVNPKILILKKIPRILWRRDIRGIILWKLMQGDFLQRLVPLIFCYGQSLLRINQALLL